MQINTQHHYTATPAAVHAMLADPAFWESLTDGCQGTTIDDGVQLALSVPAPHQARRVTGDTIHATLTATWQPTDDGFAGPIDLKVQGLPASFSGTSTVKPDGDGTTVDYTGELSIKLPIVGPSLEKQAEPYLMRVINAQQAKGADWLASHAG